MHLSKIVSSCILAVSMTVLASPVLAEAGKYDASLSDRPESELIRSETGDIIGVDITNDKTDDIYESVSFGELIKSSQWKEYEKFNITCDEEKKLVWFAGMPVSSISDEYADGKGLFYQEDLFDTLAFDASEEEADALIEIDEKKVSIIAVRNADYELQYFEFFRNTSDLE